MDVQSLRVALGWLLDYKAAGIPPWSSLVYQIWDNGQGLSEHDWVVSSSQTLQSSLCFALWFFTGNNYGNMAFNSSLTEGSGWTELPQEFRTTASFATSYTGFVVDKRMFILYILLQSLPISLCYTVLAWAVWKGHSRAESTSFPLIDFLFKARVETDRPPDNTRLKINSGIINEAKDWVVHTSRI
jgi:hypothetical protein